MMQLFSLEFWIGIQFIIDLMIVGLLLVFVKKIKQEQEKEKTTGETLDSINRAGDTATKSAREIVAMLEPLVRESTRAATVFEETIQEKKTVIKRLNNALDSKIISLNLLLTRLESLPGAEKSGQESGRTSGVWGDSQQGTSEEDVFDQQNRILDYYHQGLDVDAIASRLSIPKGEVDLVIKLKKKFLAMDQAG